MVGVGGGWASAEAGGGTATRSAAVAGDGEVARALGPGREAGLRASEAWGEPLSGGAGWWRPEPEPGSVRLSGAVSGTGAGGQKAGARGGLGGAEADWGGRIQGLGGPCRYPGSSPDCALGLTPEGGLAREAPGCHWWRAHGCQHLELCQTEREKKLSLVSKLVINSNTHFY